MAASLVNMVEDKLISLIKYEFGLIWGLNKEMDKLKRNFSAIQAVLQDAELKQHLKGQEAIKDWLRKLNDAAYQLDDILDDCATESSSRPDWLKKVCLPFLTNCFPFGFNLLFSLKIAHRMKNIRERLDEIAQERTKFHLKEMVVDKREIYRQTISDFTESEVYGREEDKEKIVEVLINHVSSDGEDLLVYPIIGMGGLGKTTLAQLVFSDARMASHFQPKIWVCVSEPFDVQRILKAIIESVTKSVCQLQELDTLSILLQDKLNGKRYLLVLDDVWNENHDEWDKLKCILKKCGAKGSSIITTTRLEMVASIMRTQPSHSYRLKGLSEGDCWLLFKQRAFESEREEYPNLVEIGKEIVKKCAGVPLAAKALGGLMRFKKEEKDWVFVKESEIWNLPQEEKTPILPALRLSYYNLPLEQRRCFAYCSVFEKDTEIEKTDLIHLWMANGFISSANGKREMEDIGNKIWNELYWRSFFQDVNEYKLFFNEVVKVTFKMHDLIHDLAHSVMDEECQIMEVERPSNNMSKNRIRHLNLIACSAPLTTMPKELQNIDSLRTLLYTEKQEMHRTNSSEFSLFENHGALRAFAATGHMGFGSTDITSLASSVGSLKHLRYLKLGGIGITTLPNSICSLWNLQTLNLDGCQSLERLPENMRCLTNLRHLITTSFWLIETPPFIGELTCLKTLSKFIVEERKAGCGIDELRCLDLAGSLSIRHLERVGNWEDAKQANLIAKQNLHSLKLYWDGNNEEEGGACEQVLEALKPSSNLQTLEIYGFNGTHFPPWMNDYLNLKELTLEYINCVEYIINDEVEGSSSNTGRGFPCLEYLSIDSLPNLRGFSRREEEEEGRAGPLFLPRLRSLEIFKCPKLTTWPKCLSALENLEIMDDEEVTSLPDNLGNYTSLRSLSLYNCPKLASIPPSFQRLTQLQTLRIWGCPQLEMRCKEGGEDWDKIAHVEWVTIF